MVCRLELQWLLHFQFNQFDLSFSVQSVYDSGGGDVVQGSNGAKISSRATGSNGATDRVRMGRVWQGAGREVEHM